MDSSCDSLHCASDIIDFVCVVFASGFILKLIVRHKKKHGFVEDEIVWEENDPEVEK